jgi:hypothetical protein
MEENGDVKEQYEIANTGESWETFRSRYNGSGSEIALEVSTTGKYVARKLRDLGFSAHLADPSKLSLIFNTVKKNDKEDCKRRSRFVQNRRDKIDPPYITFHSFSSPLLSVGNTFFLRSFSLYDSPFMFTDATHHRAGTL